MRKLALTNLIILLGLVALFRISVIKAAAQELLAQVRLNELVYHVAWSPDAQVLAVASDSGVRIYTSSLQQIALLQGHASDNKVGRVAWSPNSSKLVSLGFGDPVARVWTRDIGTNTFSLDTTLPSDNPAYVYVRTAAWSPDGSKLALVRMHQPDGFLGILGVTEILNTQTWLIERTLDDQFSFPSKDMEWSSDSTKIASAYYTCDTDDSVPACQLPTFYVADITTGATLWTQSDISVTYDLTWSSIPNGNKLVIGASDILVYDPISGNSVQAWDIDGSDIEGGLYLDWSPDGTQLVAANGEGLVNILDGETGASVLSFDTLTYAEGVQAIDWSSTGDKLAIAASLADEYTLTPGGEGLIEIWYIGSTEPTPTNGPIAFVSKRDGNFGVYRMEADGSAQTRLTNAGGQDWSPDGSMIAFRSMRHYARS